ncbi:MAG: UDP binding domain-containing protein, partial [Bacteroidota bacterium]
MVQREVSRMPVTLGEAKILVLGVAFKKDVDDTRHAPALKVMELLHADGAKNVSYNDPHVADVWFDGQHLRSQPLTQALLKKSDCVLITTDHSDYDYEFIVANSQRVIDTRNATKNVKKHRERIVLLGDGK